MWYVTPRMTDGNTTIQGFAAWNVRNVGVITEYSGHVTYTNLVLVGLGVPDVAGVTSSPLSTDLTYINSHIANFDVGMEIIGQRSTQVSGGYFAARKAIEIRGADSQIRRVDIDGPITFARVGQALLKGRPQYDVYLTNDVGEYYRSVDAIMSRDQIYYDDGVRGTRALYYNEQSSDYIPFPYADAYNFAPMEWINLTNQQLWDRFGVAYAGGLAPADAVRDPFLFGWSKIVRA